MSTEFYWIAVTLVTIVSASRLTRLLVIDKFPPIKWARDKYEDATDGTGWQLLALCGYCMSFWTTAIVVLWGWLSGVYGDPLAAPGDAVAFMVWWGFNGTFAASYLAAVFMANDGDINEDDIEDED